MTAPPDPFEAALAVLRAGGVVAAATESSFGLLADALRPDALDQLFQVKPRDPQRGVGLMVPDVATWRALLAEAQPELETLAARFWPGPLTVVAAARSGLDARLVVAGQVAVRLPGASPAAELVARFGGPLTATSANLTGEPPCTTAAALHENFHPAPGRFLVLEGDAPGGPPSTFVTWRGAGLDVLRVGALSRDRLLAALTPAL